MFRKLLVPLDGSPLAEEALTQAAAIARASKAPIELVLVHQPSGLSTPLHEADEWHAQDRYLESLAEELRSGAGVPVSHCVPRGDPQEMICRRADVTDTDLVVMTSHGRTGFSRSLLGSVADGVVRRSTVPVLVLRPRVSDAPAAKTASFNRILVPLDGSALAAGVLTAATDLARCSKAQIVLLRVVSPVPVTVGRPSIIWTEVTYIPDEKATQQLEEQARRELSQVERALRATGVKAVESHVVAAPGAAQGIIEFARGHAIDLIAMATHGRGASRLIIGSVADKVLQGSRLPMLLVRPVANVPTALTTTERVDTRQPVLSGSRGEVDPIW